jgi:hypothetical protein
MQDIGWMVGGDERDVMKTEHLATDAAHTVAGLQQVVQGDFTQANEYLGIQQLDLAVQKRQARFDFLRQRFTVVWRTAFYHVADEYIFTAVAHFLNDFVQQLPGIADKRAAELVFGLTGAFAYENDIRVVGPLAGDIVGLAFMEPALPALQDGAVQLGQVGTRVASGQIEKFCAHGSEKFQNFPEFVHKSCLGDSGMPGQDDDLIPDACRNMCLVHFIHFLDPAGSQQVHLIFFTVESRIAFRNFI